MDQFATGLELAITGTHAVAVDTLPPIHNDPFDRLLIAQALAEALTLLTADAVVGQYPGPIRVLASSSRRPGVLQTGSLPRHVSVSWPVQPVKATRSYHCARARVGLAGRRRGRGRGRHPATTALVLALGLLVSLLGVSAATAQPESWAQPTAQDIQQRDQLIANQENLLNTYRCLFKVDVDAVPGQCPHPNTVSPGVTPETPTQQDLAVRDQLIAEQEALLNVYRCRFDIDTQLVPQGCANQPDPQPTTQPAASGFTAISAGDEHSCGIRADNTIACWGDNIFGQADAPAGQFTAISTGRWHSCGIRADNTAECWGNNSIFGQTNAPAGQFTAISAGWEHSCGIRADNTIACWSWRTNLPEGVSWVN